jgi:hypothetical protein
MATDYKLCRLLGLYCQVKRTYTKERLPCDVITNVSEVVIMGEAMDPDSKHFSEHQPDKMVKGPVVTRLSPGSGPDRFDAHDPQTDQQLSITIDRFRGVGDRAGIFSVVIFAEGSQQYNRPDILRLATDIAAALFRHDQPFDPGQSAEHSPGILPPPQYNNTLTTPCME